MSRWYRRRRNYNRYKHNNYYNSYDYDNNGINPVAGLIVLSIIFFGFKFSVTVIFYLLLIFIIIKIWKRKKAEKIAIDIGSAINTDITKMVTEATEDSADNEKDKTTNSSTPQAKALYDALIKRRIKCELEKWDGHKHIDIAIPWAKLNVEIDGMQHYTDPRQMTADCQRTYYSTQKGFKTIRCPNFVIEKNLDRVADGIASVARNEYYKRI